MPGVKTQGGEVENSMEIEGNGNELPNNGQCGPCNWTSEFRYQLLLNITNAMVNQTTRQTLFKALARELSEILEFDRFSINLFDEETESLSYFTHAEGIMPPGIEGYEPRPLAKGAIAWNVIRSRKPMIIQDLNQFSYWGSAEAMIRAGLVATMAFPLVARDKVLGSMHFSFKEPPKQMDEMASFLDELSKQVAVAVDNMLAHSQLKALNDHLEQQKRFLLGQAEEVGFDPEQFFYVSRAMKDVMAQVDQVAMSNASVLITGETGTGKDYVARCIHALSHRREALFVKVNCPALAETLFESELFGHAKGAFTGAHMKRVGRLEMASGGTLFLDEIGDLPLPQQAKLLHVIQDKAFERVGENSTIRVDFRVIAATNRDLPGLIREGKFREDLFYRLNTMSIRLPALRDRARDIELLVERLTELESKAVHRPPPVYSKSVLPLLRRYRWPGNVRELRNLVKRMLILHSGEIVGEEHIKMLLTPVSSEPERPLTLAEVERRHIETVLRRTHGKISGKDGAAAVLGVPRTTLQYRMKKHGVKI